MIGWGSRMVMQIEHFVPWIRLSKFRITCKNYNIFSWSNFKSIFLLVFNINC